MTLSNHYTTCCRNYTLKRWSFVLKCICDKIENSQLNIVLIFYADQFRSQICVKERVLRKRAAGTETQASYWTHSPKWLWRSCIITNFIMKKKSQLTDVFWVFNRSPHLRHLPQSLVYLLYIQQYLSIQYIESANANALVRLNKQV